MSKPQALDLIAKATTGIAKLPVATPLEINSIEAETGHPLPADLSDFYQTVSNGLTLGRLRILPIQSKANPRKTGDSIHRNNDLGHSIWLNGDAATFRNFLVFAAEDSYRCFLFKRGSEYVWQWTQNSDQAEELDYTFWEWLEESLLQERDLLRFSS